MVLSEFQSKSEELLSATYKLKPITKASKPQKLVTVHEEIHKFDANSSKIVRELHYSEEVMSEMLDIDYVYFTQHAKDYHQALIKSGAQTIGFATLPYSPLGLLELSLPNQNLVDVELEDVSNENCSLKTLQFYDSSVNIDW